MGKIYSHESELYKNNIHQNGAYWYSKEIVRNIIPNVKTKRPWVTIRLGDFCVDHAIYFVHNNIDPELYNHIKKYKDVILVVGVPETVEKVKHLADHVIYLPLSVDVDDVMRWKRPKDKLCCYAGRKDKPGVDTLDPNIIDFLCDMNRGTMLSEVARYRFCFAVGRTAIEAKCLGCMILPFDTRFPNPQVWQIVTNQEAADILQQKLDDIDKGGKK